MQTMTSAAGISWGVLVATLTPFAILGMASAGFLWRAIATSSTRTLSGLSDLRAQIDTVERSSRSARRELWQEHRSLADRVTRGEVRAEVAHLTPIHTHTAGQK